MVIERIAIVTYNRIGEGQYSNGVIQRGDRQIFIAQNGHRSEWAADPGVDREQTRGIRAAVVTDVLSSVNLKDMDRVFLYVGTSGGEEAIRQTADIPADKVTYVMCFCNDSQKRQMIRAQGNASARIVHCECGGRDALERILKELLA